VPDRKNDFMIGENVVREEHGVNEYDMTFLLQTTSPGNDAWMRKNTQDRDRNYLRKYT
jgi:hypothetical protein